MLVSIYLSSHLHSGAATLAIPFLVFGYVPLRGFGDSERAMNFNKGPFGGHHLGGDSCPPITFEVVPN